MHFLQKKQNGQEEGNKRLINIPDKRVISLMCVVIIVVVGIFANYQQPLSASSAVSSVNSSGETGSVPVTPSNAEQVQEIERTARSTDKFANKPSIWPTRGEVTSGFGWRNSPWGDGSEFHPGIDIANSMGTPIVATADGEVVQSGPAGGYGNIVHIEHGNGIATIYGHNASMLVTVGQSVKKGQIIAYMGSTGRSTGPHVHYEIRVDGTAVDPISYLVLY